jgi:hypothetical protein
VTACGRGSCCRLPGGGATQRSPAKRERTWTPCAPGGSASPTAAWLPWPIAGAAAVHDASPGQVAEVKALACQLPAETGTPLSRWSCPEPAREVAVRRIAGSISASTVRRWLREDTLKPWQYRSWIFLRDPKFPPKAARIMDLNAGTFGGVPLGADEYVVSSDEKTSIQARCRCHPTLAPGQARAMRVNHEYRRGGALACLAAYDVHHARVLGRCEQRGQR